MSTSKLAKLIGARLVRANATDFADRPHPPEEDSGLTMRDLIALEAARTKILTALSCGRGNSRAAAIKDVEDAMRALQGASDVLQRFAHRRPPHKPSSDD